MTKRCKVSPVIGLVSDKIFYDIRGQGTDGKGGMRVGTFVPKGGHWKGAPFVTTGNPNYDSDLKLS